MQYIYDNKWKRLQFTHDLSSQMFNNDEFVAALRVIDNRSYIYKSPLNGEGILVDSDTFKRALRVPNEMELFTSEEVQIRVLMDGMLENLRFFEHALESGLVEKENIKIYLYFWIKRIFTTHIEQGQWMKDQQSLVVWLQYILTHDFKPAFDLCRRIDQQVYDNLKYYAMNLDNTYMINFN